MWNWKKSGRPESPATSSIPVAPRFEPLPPPPAGPTAAPASPDDAAVDAVGAILRTLGQYAFDLTTLDASSFRRDCEAWALHVLVGAPRPGLEVGLVATTASRRDYAGLRQFVFEHRREEQRHVTRGLADLRQAIRAFVQGLKAVFAQDQGTDEQVLAQLDSLKTIVDERSPEDIKREVLSIVASVSQLLEERRGQQHARLEELDQRVSTLGDQLQEARQENAIDPLTRLFNRRALDEYVDQIVSLRDVFGKSACLLMVDVDHFKTVNDVHGHPTGDAVLRQLADCLVSNFLRKNDFVARYGGEEFVVILPETGLRDGWRLAERLLDTVRALEIRYEEKVLRITVSIGLSVLRTDEEGATWLARADQALYRSKQDGRDRLAEA